MSNIDANLLLLFKYLWEERSSTRAAKRLHVTQSAVSQSLKKLRVALNDELFVRVPGGLTPTPFAEEVSSQLLSTVDSIEDIFRQGVQFDPQEAKGTFSLAATDYFERLALGSLLSTVLNQAPNVRIRSTLLSGELPKKDLQNGTVDCAIAGYFNNIPDGFYQKKIFTDEFIGICRKGHPYLKSKQSLTEYCKYPHILVSISGDFRGILDKKMPNKYNRHIALTTTSFLSTPQVLNHSDALFVLPARLGKLHAETFDLKTFETPVALNKITIQMVWHERSHRDPMQKWMRDRISDVFAD